MGQKLTTEEKRMKNKWQELHDGATAYAKLAARQEYAKMKFLGQQPDLKNNTYIQEGKQYSEGLMEFPEWYEWKTGKKLEYIQKKKVNDKN